jgi:hypothetical protein
MDLAAPSIPADTAPEPATWVVSLMSGKTTTILEIVQLDQLPEATTVFADPDGFYWEVAHNPFL